MKKALWTVLLFLLFAMPYRAHGQDFHVVKISEDLQEVTLASETTREQWVARKGDTVEGWKVVEIDPLGVKMARLEPGNMIYVIQLPIVRQHSITSLPPK